ncbi:MAG: 16S rRNA (guanine(527)-N(7))-methyltransferase RsmG [Actinomycetota bacterium]|nr:16S rRNA (guanine(527)-N(7))-methyltransferase RsmG [Actinomycetota bacterium]
MLELLAADHRSLSSVTDPAEAWRAHVADSMTGLEVSALARAETIADLGAGAGFPGLVLALALPGTTVDLIESVGRKCEFMREAISAARIPNARVVNCRSEEHAAPRADGREAYDAVTARAVARLATLAELASPLLREGGALVAWKGRRDADEEAELERAGKATAMAWEAVIEVGERAGYEHRHLHVIRKRGATPERLPRRPGVAKKRPPGG